MSSFAKEDPDEAEEKFEEKDDQSPWADSDDEDNNDRVLGWRDGESLTRRDLRQILQREPQARERYESLRRDSASKKRPVQVEALSGLPPEWQAVYALAPDADPQVAWSRAKLEESRSKRQKKETLDDRLQWESRPGESIEQEITRLKSEAAEVKKDVSANKKVQEDWAKKVEDSQAVLKEGKAVSRTVLRAFETASYDHSVAKGQLRSSEMYFQFLTQDTKQNTQLQVSTLERSCALMDKTMDLLKGHIRTLNEVANMSSASELEPFFSPSPQLGAVPATKTQKSPAPGKMTPRTGAATPHPGVATSQVGVAGPSPLQRASKLKALKVPPVSPSLRD